MLNARLEGFFSHLCLANCSVLSAARLVVESWTYHSIKNSHLGFLLRLSAAEILVGIKALVQSNVSAQVLKFSSTARIGPRCRRADPFSICD